jgi:pimeloyl-ACP methyl ester carboxylesterase
MLAYEVTGDGPALLLVHGTMGSRGVWAPIRERLARERRLILIDLPGMGESLAIAGAHVPRDWIGAIGEVLDAVGVMAPAVVGHSMGGWTALELAKAGRAASVLALAPAGMWERSPREADMSLRIGRTMSRVTPPRLSARGLTVPAIRRVAMRDLSVDAGAIPAEWAVALGGDVRRATGFREHFRAARSARFRGGDQIDVPVRVVFADRDRIATPARGQLTDELPAHAVIERWEDCGHVVMWDAPARVVDAALELKTTR